MGQGNSSAGQASGEDLASSLLLRLLPIPGPSGQEAEIAGFVRELLRQEGVSADQVCEDDAHCKSPLKGQVGNLIVKLPGTYPAPRRLLMAHLDTVPICVGAEPERVGNQLRAKLKQPPTGLGADNRAGTAVLLTVITEILRKQLEHPPLTFLWTVQEEVGLHGARHLDTSLLGRPEFAFNWDGGAPEKLTLGATGGYRMSIDVRGKASHAGNAPERGVSAIVVASRAIARLHETGWHGLVQQAGGQGTANVGVISGGQATNVVTDHVHLRAEARSHDPAFRQQIVARIEEEFRQAARETVSATGDSGTVEFRGQLDYESFRLPADHPTVRAAEAAVVACGLQPLHAITNGGLDANWMTAHGIPTVTLGCGQLGQHTVDEALDLDQFAAACRIGLWLATQPFPSTVGGDVDAA